MATSITPLPPLVVPSAASTAVFLVIVALICAAWLVAARRTWPGTRAALVTAIALASCLALTAFLARSGAFAALANSPLVALYFGGSNLLALALALSPVGTRMAQQLPIHWLVGVQAFRLPLELVLHNWFESGTVPVQMTYQGENFDIITGVLSALALVALPRLNTTARYWLAVLSTVVGFGLLVNVMRIAMLSTPWPLRAYLNDPPLLLAFYAPYTWILPICVSGALFGHVVSVRWLWAHRLQAASTTVRA